MDERLDAMEATIRDREDGPAPRPAAVADADRKETLEKFLLHSSDRQIEILSAMRKDVKEHGSFIHDCMLGIQRLESLRTTLLGGPEAGKRQLNRTRILLETELLEHWLDTGPASTHDRSEALGCLRAMLGDNPCLRHPLVEEMGGRMGRQGLAVILRLMSTHREIMELERALVLVGLQGGMAAAVRGPGTGSRTLAPRSALEAWKLLRMPRTPLLRRWDEPWFCKIVRESFLMSASRPGWKFRAYGSLMAKESWSCPHMGCLLRGMERIGLLTHRRSAQILSRIEDSKGYSQAMMKAIEMQHPRLEQEDIEEILFGTRLAVSLAHRLFDLGLDLLGETVQA